MNTELEQRLLSALTTNQLDKAAEYLAVAYNDNIDMSKILMYTAIVYEGQHMPEKAMCYYRASLALDGTNKATLYNLYRLAESKKEPIRFL